MLCELCGEEVSKVYKVMFEGDLLNVCFKCMKRYNLQEFKGEVRSNLKSKFREKRSEKSFFNESTNLVLVEDYGLIVKRARESKGLSQSELAKMLGEKVSIIRKIESNKLIPPDYLIYKLEKALRIKLREEV